MSYLLPHLNSGFAVDQAILAVRLGSAASVTLLADLLSQMYLHRTLVNCEQVSRSR